MPAYEGCRSCPVRPTRWSSGAPSACQRLLRGEGAAPGGVGDLEFRAGEAITDHIERLCARGSLLLVLEDVHWADPATLACLARLARTVGQLPLLLIATVRPSPRPPELARLLGTLVDRGASSTTLGPLAQDAVSELTEAAAGVAPGPNLVRQLHRASGNPLLVLEMLAALERAGATETTDRCIEIDSTSALPAIPSLTILHRLSFLSRDTLDLLGMASVMGSSFSVADLSLVSGRPAAGLAGPLREALAAGALADHGDRVGFRHELIREALYRDLPGSLREALHRDLARALAAAGYPPGRVAEHLVRGARPGDAEAVAWLRRAAQEAGARAPTVAVDLLEHALELATPDTRAYGRVAADHAIALTFAGYAEKGETALRTVLARHDDPERDGLLRRLLLQSILFTGRAADALADADEALRQPGVSAADRAHYLTFASFARLNLGELEPAVKLADEAIALAEPTGDSAAVSVALHNKAVVRDLQGRLVEYADLAVLAVHALEAEPDPRGPQHPHASAGLALMCTDRVAEGREMMQRGRHLNERLGAPTGLAVHHTALAEGLFLVGEWDDALSEIEAADNLVSDNPVWPVAGFGIRALVALHRDDLLAAKAHLAATDAALARGEAPRRLDRLALARAMLAEAQGRPEAALPALNEYWQGMRMAGICQGDLELGPELVRRLAGAGQHEDAANVAAAVEETAAHSPGVPSVCAAAQHCRGLVTSDTEVLLAAVAGYRAGARPLSRALACEDAAAALVTADRIAEARELLREALTLQEALRANRGAARTAAALRALGVRRGTRTSRTRPEEGWEALTPTEHKVVALLAQRLSNPEIAERMYLSRRTVETHVSHVLAKLGLRSRLELAAEAERRDATRTVRLS